MHDALVLDRVMIYTHPQYNKNMERERNELKGNICGLRQKKEVCEREGGKKGSSKDCSLKICYCIKILLETLMCCS